MFSCLIQPKRCTKFLPTSRASCVNCSQTVPWRSHLRCTQISPAIDQVFTSTYPVLYWEDMLCVWLVGVRKTVYPTGELPTHGIRIGVMGDISKFCAVKTNAESRVTWTLDCQNYLDKQVLPPFRCGQDQPRVVEKTKKKHFHLFWSNYA